MYDQLILWLIKLLLSQYWSTSLTQCPNGSVSRDHSIYSSYSLPARVDQKEGEQGAGGAGREDRQGQHLEAGDRREREPAQHGAGRCDRYKSLYPVKLYSISQSLTKV